MSAQDNCRETHPAPLKILQILEATTGGTRRHLYYLLANVNRERFTLSLVYSSMRDPAFSKDLEVFRELGIRLHEVPMRREISPWHDLAALVKIMRIIRKERFDIVHAHSSKAGFLGRLAARLLGVRAVIYSPHSFSFQYCARGCRGAFYLWLERLASRWHDCLLCVSEGERRIAIEHGLVTPKQIVVLPNAVALDSTKPLRTATEVREELGIAQGETVVGMVAHFRPQKGYSFFIGAIPAILRSCPKARFLIVGDGPLFGQAKKRIAELGVEHAVILAGYQDHTPDYYQVMDVFILSSLWEGLPYVILEAMTFGLPIVASDIHGNNELVVHGRNGFLVAPMSSPKIAEFVTRLVEDEHTRAAFGRESKRMADSMSSIQQWTESYEDAYLDALGIRSGPL